MKAADIIVAHYNAHKQQWVDVPEWKGADGNPLRIHWTLLTVAEAEEFVKSDASMDLDILVRYARDAAGKKMFDIADKQALRVSADSNLISRIARLIVGPARTLESMVDDAEKNLMTITNAVPGS